MDAESQGDLRFMTTPSQAPLALYPPLLWAANPSVRRSKTHRRRNIHPMGPRL